MVTEVPQARGAGCEIGIFLAAGRIIGVLARHPRRSRTPHDFLPLGSAIPGRPTKTLPSRGVFGVSVWVAVITLLWGTTASAAEGGLAIDKATALRVDGKYDEALEVLRSESRDIKSRVGEDSPQLLPINALAAEILIDQGSLDDAEKLLAKAFASRQQLIDSGHSPLNPELAKSLMTLAHAQGQVKRYADAAETARRALLIQDQSFGPATAEVAATVASLETILDSAAEFLGPSDRGVMAARDETAATFESLGLLAAATRQRRAMLAVIGTPGSTSDEYSFAEISRLCRLMMLTGWAHEAIPVADTAVDVFASSTPPSVEPLRLLGELQLAAGQFVEANASFQTAATAVQGIKGVSPLAGSADRLNTLLVDARRGRRKPLPEWFLPEVKALAAPGPTDRDTAVAALAVAAQILASQGDPAAAAEQLTKALGLVASEKPPSAVKIADLSGRLAAVQLATGKTAAAFDLAKAALAEAESKLGSGDARVTFLRIVLAKAFHRRDDKAAAAATLRRALSRQLPRPDDIWEEYVASVVDELASAGSDNDFRELFLESRKRQFGPEHRHVGLAMGLLASSRLTAAESDDDCRMAVDLFTRSLVVLRAALGDEHPEVAATKALLAYAERAAGDPAQAASTAADALAAWERLAGEDHPGTLAAADVLVSARLDEGNSTDVEPLLERLCTSASMFTPAQQADHLVRLAGLLLPRDRARAEDCLTRAMDLPCWQAEAFARPQDRVPLAFTAARASFAFKQLGHGDQSVKALRAARSWATRSPNANSLLGHIEALAESGRTPPGS